MNKHLTADELVDRIYGLGESEHLAACSECSQRLEQMRERQSMAVEPPPASYEFLAAQRRTIYARMGEKPQTRHKWVPALAAAACLIAFGVFSHHSPSAAPVVKTEIDAQVFSDVYSMEQSMEPMAAKPIHALFEDPK